MARSLAATWAARLLLVRWIVRAPVWLYRARLGFVFGSRLLMLEHTGRKSGAARYVVLEVVDAPSPDVRVVASGFGERAQWLRNVRANPRGRIYVGGHRPVPAVAHELDATERRAALSTYARRHPRSWKRLRPVLEKTLGTPIDTSGTALPMVALTSRTVVRGANRQERP
ncbi:MAG TPA: nitroreductase family deazaflavin-dependent oxidoreductase [Gemmatimonadales bacterium]|nr:nitroreductase family deazaflavin-dependent oxidoreductase [Gemmatimonadales bacterium]